MKRNSLLIAALIAGLPPAPAMAATADQAGDTRIQIGWYFLNTPSDSSSELRTTILASPTTTAAGIPESFSSPGTGASANNSNTLAFAITHFMTDKLSLEFAGGLPAEFDVQGKGVIAPNGNPAFPLNVNLGAPQNNPLAVDARQWSPTLLLQYHFLRPDARLRPYLGVGVSYTWFTHIRLDPQFQSAVNNGFGAALAAGAGEPLPVSTSASADSSWVPVLNGGLRYAIDDRWSVTASASYLPLETTATIKVKSGDGARLATSKADIDLDPVVATVLVGYRF